jgi:DNA-directed RNA polymerase alpha subunit/DNA-directed RNA polymerase subunit L
MSFSKVRPIDRNTVGFTLSPLTVSYANTLRRIILTGVETASFRASIDAKGRTGDVVVEHNDTPLTNEMLAHRVGLLPLAIRDPLAFNPENYTFVLDVKNEADRPRDVCAGDFEVYEQVSAEQEPIRVATDKFFPANPMTGDTALIAVLKGKQFGQAKGEAIKLRVKAAVSTGREHATFSPVSQCSYVYTPDSDPAKLKEVFERWLGQSKNLSISEIQADEGRRVELEREFNTMEVARCYLQDERGEPFSYDFTIETVGVLSVAYIVRRACEVAEAMFMRYATADSGELPEGLTIQRTTMSMAGYDFFFKGHDHTLGNTLQTYIVENFIENESVESDLEPVNYAGYCVPHPLTDVMKLTIGVQDASELTARKALATAARGCAEIFRRLRTEWLEAVKKA